MDIRSEWPYPVAIIGLIACFFPPEGLFLGVVLIMGVLPVGTLVQELYTYWQDHR